MRNPDHDTIPASMAVCSNSWRCGTVTKTVRLDADVIDWLVTQAEEEGLPYQTFMNAVLRKAMSQESLEARVKHLEEAVLSK